MASVATDALAEILRLLAEQQELLKHWPYSTEQIDRDKKISARIRDLVDQICARQAPPHLSPDRRSLRPAV
jgi:hypothetical protein